MKNSDYTARISPFIVTNHYFYVNARIAFFSHKYQYSGVDTTICTH